VRVPLSSPDITEEEIEVVSSVLRLPTLSLGPKLEEFESAMAETSGTRYAVGLSSGTAGLHLSLLALGVGPGDEVIVPSFAFIAVANAARYAGAEPVFVDVCRKSLNITAEGVEAAMTARTKAIIIVHTFGRPADMVAVLEVAARWGVAVVEDACEAIGGAIRGRRLGSFGDVGIFGFYPNKQITTGEGGAAVTNDARIYAKLRTLRNQGRGPGDDWLQHSELGYNYRLSEINCALGVGQLRRLDEILSRRAEVAEIYSRELATCSALELPQPGGAGESLSWFVYVVRLNLDRVTLDRDQTVRELAARGVACGRYFAPIHLQPSYAGWRDRYALPVTEEEAMRTLALPFFNRIRHDEIAYVCQSVRDVLG
jgi:perosamine synthetase